MNPLPSTKELHQKKWCCLWYQPWMGYTICCLSACSCYSSFSFCNYDNGFANKTANDGARLVKGHTRGRLLGWAGKDSAPRMAEISKRIAKVFTRNIQIQYKSDIRYTLRPHKLHHFPSCVILWIHGTFFMQPSHFVQYSVARGRFVVGGGESLMAWKTTKVASHHGETERQTDRRDSEGTSNKP